MKRGYADDARSSPPPPPKVPKKETRHLVEKDLGLWGTMLVGMRVHFENDYSGSSITS